MGVIDRLTAAISQLRHGLRRQLRRHPRLRPILTILLITGAALLTARAVASAAEVQASLGRRRAAPVARADLAVGHVLATGDIEWRDLPVGLVPDGSSPDPVGRTVISPILAGEVLMAPRLSGSATAGPAALMDRSDRAVAIERDALTPTLHPGDRVDLFGPGVRGSAVLLARRALVLSSEERAVLVGVSAGEAASVARAALDRTLIIALVGAG